MSRFLSEKYKKLDAYVPGEQPKDKKYIKLNTNELPYGPSPEVLKCITENDISDLNLYPDPNCTDLVTIIAKHLKVKPENIMLTNGSDDALNFSFMAFCDKNTGAAFPDLTYGFYSVFANLNGIDYLEIPLEDDFTVDVNKYVNLGRTIFIANPNAPTGIALTLDKIRFILDNNKDNVVIVDEAYVDFGGESATRLIDKYDNLLVIQTFSKSKALAGGRLGYAVGCAELIKDLNLLRFSTNPYNIDRLTLKIGVETIKSIKYYERCCEFVMDGRKILTEELEDMGFVVLPSKTNFVFAKFPGIDGESIYLKLKERGILVRHFKNERIKDFNRISIGNGKEIATLIDTLKEIIGELK